MEIKKTPVQIPLTWLHVWLLFAGIYGFAAGFLELTGREALYFCAISLLLLIPAAASWILIRKTKALWQFLLGGIVVCAVTYLAAKFFCSLFSVQAAAVIEAAAAANDGKNKFENGISPAFLESLSGVMTGLMAAVIFLIRGYVRIRKGQLKKAAQELPAGSMPLADMEAWEIPTLLDEPKPLHFLWFMIQYVIGVLMKMPFYWHLIYWFFFADVFLCFFCQYLDGMHGFIRDHQKIANLPVETMQRTGKLILKIAVLLLVLFVLPSALYGKDPIAEAIAGYEPKELESDLGIKPVNHGYLKKWAEQGVLMLNSVLTVRNGQAFSHKGKGWERLTDAAIEKLSSRPGPVVFILWGRAAQDKISLIDTTKNIVLKSAHPSPLSASRGFFGSRPFSKTN